jgi:hypothetical protein
MGGWESPIWPEDGKLFQLVGGYAAAREMDVA